MTNTTEIKYTFANLNDSQKQKLVDRMLNDHPLRLQNTLVEYVLQKSYEDLDAPFSYEDITNFEYYGEVCINDEWEEFTESERDEKVSELEDEQTDLEIDDPEWDEIQEIIDDLNNMDFDQLPEIYQWFSCSDWLIRELESKGQCTLDDEFWGRQCCGQSVVLDNVMQEIAFEYACDYGNNYLTADQFFTLN
ncbi:hypothetical protein VPHG_00044 [Vibrio phage 11895-B1]|uniref:hypothetical protein n=1 Tax=Vibrio phage 11895-B1 TaxID=754075 RepID=UPI0002C0869D|nr:hypothetical protein VPHG_00044 [Vibrio phage 11895-B1]AGH32111.1 hypothetical protein VPHG_00044 [Vibrio phage 11895-B1]